MSSLLGLDNVRNALLRLEETILFAVIERAQFLANRAVYEPGRFGPGLGGDSLVGFLLHECEISHAKVRRYTSPDEHPFYDDLPPPILPALAYDNPLHANSVNINPEVRTVYERDMIPRLCRAGDDSQYGSSAVCDVACLQAISRRIHYGKFVAETKYRAAPSAFRPIVEAGDAGRLMAMITDEAVERQVLDRVRQKAQMYTRELAASATAPVADPESVGDLYRCWIIPLNKQVQVLYLLQRRPE